MPRDFPLACVTSTAASSQRLRVHTRCAFLVWLCPGGRLFPVPLDRLGWSLLLESQVVGDVPEPWQSPWCSRFSERAPCLLTGLGSGYLCCSLLPYWALLQLLSDTLAWALVRLGT